MAKKKPARKSSKNAKKTAKKTAPRRSASAKKAAPKRKAAKRPAPRKGEVVMEIAEIEVIGEAGENERDDEFPPDYGGSE